MLLPIDVLIKNNRLSWGCLHIGFKKGWVTKENISNFSVQMLENGVDSDDVSLLIDSTLDMRDVELKLLKLSSENESEDQIMGCWLWAFLKALQIKSSSDDDKINELQEIYSEFGYPEVMLACSIYSQNEKDPLVAMNEVITILDNELPCLSKRLNK